MVVERIVEADAPADAAFIEWAQAACEIAAERLGSALPGASELSVIVVDEAEMASLNSQYRGKTGSTNVLSFAMLEGENVPLGEFRAHETGSTHAPTLLGDVVICHDVVVYEARAADKQIDQHYAHMTIHGTLHLLGFDHETKLEAAEMECLEIKALAKFGFENPY